MGEENIDARNEAQLLKRFDETTIANPQGVTISTGGKAWASSWKFLGGYGGRAFRHLCDGVQHSGYLGVDLAF